MHGIIILNLGKVSYGMNNIAIGIKEREYPINPCKDLENYSDFTSKKLVVCQKEFFVFQFVLKAMRQDYSVITIRPTIKTNAYFKSFTVFNYEGNNVKGQYYFKDIGIKADKAKVFWAGIELNDGVYGSFQATFEVYSDAVLIGEQDVTFYAESHKKENFGYDPMENLGRLNWLNSTRGIDERVTKEYVPIVKEKNKIHILGRTIELQNNGLIKQVQSFFDIDNSIINPDKPKQLFKTPMQFKIAGNKSQSATLEYTKITDSQVSFVGTQKFEAYDLITKGTVNFDGYISYSATVYAKADLEIDDILLKFVFPSNVAKYMVGLGYGGGDIPDKYTWKWDIAKHQDSVFLGNVNVGMLLQLKAVNYNKPHVNMYYKNSPLVLPINWDNDGQGVLHVVKNKEDVTLSYNCGGRQILKGSQVEYDFALMLTPLKKVDWNKKWSNRYYHVNTIKNQYDKIPLAKEALANIINIHHAADVYPFINYPFYDTDIIQKLIETAHQQDVRFKLYYTVRELTNHIAEMFPFLVLDDEIIPYDVGKTHGMLGQVDESNWFEKNLGSGRVIAAWISYLTTGKYKGGICSSMVVNSTSRIANYFVEGLYYLLNATNMDGIYVDDCGLDRFTFARVRKVMDDFKAGCLVDLHSPDHNEDHYGAAYTSTVNLYMPLFPYIDSLWFGESFNYTTAKPDHFLTTICGLMYGMTGEMLGETSNNYKGLVYGMTSRVYTDKDERPTPFWKLLLDWNIQDATLYGYWDEKCQVGSSDAEVCTAVYLRGEDMLLVVTNFSDTSKTVTLNSNFDANDYHIYAPTICGHQVEADFDIYASLTLESGKGKIVLIEKKK